MKKAFAVGLFALGAGGCGGPDVGYYCEQTLKCTESMGIDIGNGLADACEDYTDGLIDDQCKDSEADDIADAISDCKAKKGCDFVTCFGTKAADSYQCLIPEVPDYSECGDGFADGDEACDGTDLWGESCSSQTAGAKPSGMLKCKDDCTFDTSGCM